MVTSVVTEGCSTFPFPSFRGTKRPKQQGAVATHVEIWSSGKVLEHPTRCVELISPEVGKYWCPLLDDKSPPAEDAMLCDFTESQMESENIAELAREQAVM